LRRDDGFGLIELLIAMTVMAIGISAIVAGFSSGLVALNNASRTGTAGTLADRQMEAYRALPYASIGLTSAPSPALDSTHVSDAAYDLANAVPPPATCTPSTATCMPVQTQASGLAAPDGRNYRLDTYVAWTCPLGTLHMSTYNGTPFTSASPGCTDTATPPVSQSRPVKKITVVVRDGATPTRTFVRETSTFDAAT
jgi:prepilin-type N-terminal cleavage/methylation domain-containing protein